MDTVVRQSIFLPPTDFWLLNDAETDIVSSLEYYPFVSHLAIGFNDANRRSNGTSRVMVASLPFPRDYFKPSGATEDDFSVIVRIPFAFSGGRSDLVPIGVVLGWIRSGENDNNNIILHSLQPLTSQPISSNTVYIAEFVVSPNSLPSTPLSGGTLYLRIRRQYVGGENEIVRVLGATILYPALL
jgi:hypothetical protein